MANDREEAQGLISRSARQFAQFLVAYEKFVKLFSPDKTGVRIIVDLDLFVGDPALETLAPIFDSKARENRVSYEGAVLLLESQSMSLKFELAELLIKHGVPDAVLDLLPIANENERDMTWHYAAASLTSLQSVVGDEFVLLSADEIDAAEDDDANSQWRDSPWRAVAMEAGTDRLRLVRSLDEQQRRNNFGL